MAKYDVEDWKKNGRTPKVDSDVDLNLKVVIMNQLKENALDVTNSNERVVSNPKSDELGLGVIIRTEVGGLNETKKMGKSKSGDDR